MWLQREIVDDPARRFGAEWVVVLLPFCGASENEIELLRLVNMGGIEDVRAHQKEAEADDV